MSGPPDDAASKDVDKPGDGVAATPSDPGGVDDADLIASVPFRSAYQAAANVDAGTGDQAPEQDPGQSIEPARNDAPDDAATPRPEEARGDAGPTEAEARKPAHTQSENPYTGGTASFATPVPAEPDAIAASAPPPEETRYLKRRRRRAAWLGVRGMVLIIAAPMVFALLLPVLMIGQEITAPSWIKARVEAQAAAVLGGGSLTFGEITVEVGRDLHPVIRIREAVLRDAAGSLLARVPIIESGVSPRGLILRREVLPQRIRLTGAEVALRRDEDGRVAISFDTRGREAFEAASLPALIESFDRVFERPALEALETLAVSNLVLNYQDDRAGRAWVVDGGRVTLALTDTGMDLSADLAVLSGRSYVTTLRLAYQSPRGSALARLVVEVADVAASDIATQSPALSWLGVLDARMSARIEAGTNADGSLAPLAGQLEIGAGVLQPAAGSGPIAFDRLSAALDFAPDEGRIGFSRFDVESDIGTVTARGHAYLRDMDGGLPGALVGQFQVAQLSLGQSAVMPVPVALNAAYADFRLTLEPFAVEVAQFGLRDGDHEDAARLTGSADIAAGGDGWRVAVDARVDRMGQARLMSLWPEGVRPGTRAWFAENLLDGEHLGLSLGVRVVPGSPPVWAFSESFDDVVVRPMRTLPPIARASGTIQMQDNAMVLSLDAGTMRMPQGGGLSLGGSVFEILDLTSAQAPARVSLETTSSLTAAFSLLDQSPFGYLTAAGLPVTLAEGRARVVGAVGLPLAPGATRDAIDFGFDAVLTGVESDELMPGRRLTADRLEVSVSETELALSGAVRIGDVAARGTWRQPLGQGAGAASRIEADVHLDAAFFDEFNIALPNGMVSGAGEGHLVLTLRRGVPTAFRLTSDLRGLALSIPAVGWAKGPGTAGTFVIAGRLGAVPEIDSITISAPGFNASGSIALRENGQLDRISLSEVRVGGWLSVAVDLIGRGAGRPPEIRIDGGALDLRRAEIGQGSGQGRPGQGADR